MSKSEASTNGQSRYRYRYRLADMLADSDADTDTFTDSDTDTDCLLSPRHALPHYSNTPNESAISDVNLCKTQVTIRVVSLSVSISLPVHLSIHLSIYGIQNTGAIKVTRWQLHLVWGIGHRSTISHRKECSFYALKGETQKQLNDAQYGRPSCAP